MSEKTLQFAWWGTEVRRPTGGWGSGQVPCLEHGNGGEDTDWRDVQEGRAGARVCGVDVSGEKGVCSDCSLWLGDRAQCWGHGRDCLEARGLRGLWACPGAVDVWGWERRPGLAEQGWGSWEPDAKSERVE